MAGFAVPLRLLSFNVQSSRFKVPSTPPSQDRIRAPPHGSAHFRTGNLTAKIMKNTNEYKGFTGSRVKMRYPLCLPCSGLLVTRNKTPFSNPEAVAEKARPPFGAESKPSDAIREMQISPLPDLVTI